MGFADPVYAWQNFIALTIFKFNVSLQVLTMLINNYMIINVMHILSIATA